MAAQGLVPQEGPAGVWVCWRPESPGGGPCHGRGAGQDQETSAPEEIPETSPPGGAMQAVRLWGARVTSCGAFHGGEGEDREVAFPWQDGPFEHGGKTPGGFPPRGAFPS